MSSDGMSSDDMNFGDDPFEEMLARFLGAGIHSARCAASTSAAS